MPIVKSCKVCGKLFSVAPSLANERECCSRECRGKSQSKKVRKSCSVCGKEFEIKAYRKESATCSKECSKVAKKIEKECVICSSVFYVPKSRAETAKTCSNECAKKLRPISNTRKVSLVCECCGKTFYEAESHAERRRFCSKQCMSRSDVYRKEQADRVIGGNNPNWNGGKAGHSDGYIYTLRPGHPFNSHSGYVFEHRLIIEGIMRSEAPDHDFLIEINGVKYLRQEIHVHHIDLSKINNNPNNLVALTASSHRAIHNGGKPKPGTYWPETVTNFILTTG